MVIRCRCCPINDRKNYKLCSERVDTAHYHLLNDSKTYKKLETCKTKKQKEKVIVSYLHHKLRIIPRVEKEKIIKYYWKQEEDCDMLDCYCDMIGCKMCFPEPSEEEKMDKVLKELRMVVEVYDPLIIYVNRHFLINNHIGLIGRKFGDDVKVLYERPSIPNMYSKHYGYACIEPITKHSIINPTSYKPIYK
jgi:hypothetical protein